jgi:3-oxoacyl-[acyl-carrier-protein] synthase III
MRYDRVCIESFGYELPEERITSDEIEQRLLPLYERLRLPAGRLELITGIRERRFWAPGTLPSEKSIVSGRRAIENAGIDPEKIGALVHGSVCRDHLEPATACSVHHGLDLPQECMVYDVSNACLGLLNGIVQVANMIELGQIRAGMVVGTEGSRELVENTIKHLNEDTSLTRNQLKRAIASLTIGSASCAVLLVDRELSRTGNRLTSAMVRTNTEHHQLCHSGRDEAVSSGMAPLMDTDSETLMHAGIATGREAFTRFLHTTGWQRSDIDKTFCHQVGITHRNMMFEQLELDTQLDFTTVETLGNTGSVALPVTLAMGAEQGRLAPKDRVALMGIGSGINTVMLGVEWQTAPVKVGLVSSDSPSVAATVAST